MEVKFQCWDREYSQMYHNAWPFEHLVYVEMSPEDARGYEHKMEKVNGKWFYFLLRKDVDLRQYTGLKDKNGKEGYQDDLVKMFDRSLFQIVWSDDYARFQLKLVQGREITAIYSMDMLLFAEIVGNVYEHPELLELGRIEPCQNN